MLDDNSYRTSDPPEVRYRRSLLGHKILVGKHMQAAINALMWRAVVHDYSKFVPAEYDAFVANQPTFETVSYGTPEYRAALKAIKPAIQHHYQNNSHHPEHWENGVNDMNLLDVLEMVCDWMAAAQRVPGDTLQLAQLKERFGISDQLMGIIEHTVDWLNNPE